VHPPEDFHDTLAGYVGRIESGIDSMLPAANAAPGRLHAAMRYALQAGGKRVRPALVLSAAGLFDPESRIDPLPAAVAVECVHTYSLIHDDLPCMDNDDLRRGRPTCHKAFDEATALLAGDALLTFAFTLLPTAYAAQPALAVALGRELGTAAGSRKLVGGQMADLLAEHKPEVTARDIEFIHLNKTAAMIEASLVMGALIGGAGEAALAALRRAGRHLGMAFQIIDDILDATGDAATLGKTPGKDVRAGKATFPGLHGLESSRRMAQLHTEAADEAFHTLPGDVTLLVGLTRMLVKRTN
jgi:geranylgeranyl diphosphate synthase type II